MDGLARLVLHAPGGQVCLAEAEAVTALPETGLALVATEGLTVPPLPVAPHGPAHPERAVRLHIPHRVDGTVLGTTTVTYTATDRFHLLGEVYELALGEADLARSAAQASGAPLFDAATGAVLGVVATALHSGHRAAGFAVPLDPAGAPEPLARLLRRNAATVPAYGRHLNLAGALQLTATSVGTATGPGEWREPVARDDVTAALRDFLTAGTPEGGLSAGPGSAGHGARADGSPYAGARVAQGEGADAGPEFAAYEGRLREAVPQDPCAYAAEDAGPGASSGPRVEGQRPLVLGLVGEPGAGRSVELAQLAARRTCGPQPEPTLWLRGAELRPGDGSLRDAVERALRTAARIVGAGRPPNGAMAPLWPAGGADDPSPDAVAEIAHLAGRPLLVLLDAPEEMPPVLAHALADWTAGTARWLRSGQVRLVVACRPEFWEQAGALLPRELLYRAPAAGTAAAVPSRALPPCLPLGDLSADQAARARTRYGLRPGDLAEPDAAHPLAMRLLSELRAALPEELDADLGEREVPPSRVELFSAHLDLVCLRIAVRLAAASEPPVRGTGVRRLAARVAGRTHEAARRCLGPGQGELDREAFEELFPWRTGWASAVLTEGLLVPAGAGYRFAHEEAADWLQSLHLDLPTALYALVHRWFAPAGVPSEAPVRLPSRRASTAGQPPPVPPAPAVAPQGFPRSLPVPHHRAAPVVQALLLTPPTTLATHLHGLIEALDHPALAPRPPRVPPQTPRRPEAARGVPAGAAPGGPGGRPTRPGTTADAADDAAGPTSATWKPAGEGTEAATRCLPAGAPPTQPAAEADLDADTVPSPRTRPAGRPAGEPGSVGGGVRRRAWTTGAARWCGTGRLRGKPWGTRAGAGGMGGGWPARDAR
ncbi:MAG: hypothetical protein FWE15_31675, partial [Actinomycetia bacterium]|nr:hypothetical protein [Actinomycetes bacterium]